MADTAHLKCAGEIHGGSSPPSPIGDTMNNVSESDIRKMNSKGAHVVCPDCFTCLVEGPSGGCSMNMYCRNCDVWFNVGFGFGGIWTCEVVAGYRKIPAIKHRPSFIRRCLAAIGMVKADY